MQDRDKSIIVNDSGFIPFFMKEKPAPAEGSYMFLPTVYLNSVFP